MSSPYLHVRIHHSKMVSKILTRDSSSKGVMETRLKCLRYRGVTSFRPPPGGPMAATNCTSTKVRKLWSERSYHPLWSMNCLRSSMGGCAPYVSFSGMFRSSMKSTQRLPSGGPNTPLRRLSSLPSIMSCVWFALVCAEKLTAIDWYTLWSRPPFGASLRFIYMVLPVPVGPAYRTWCLCVSSVSRIQAYLSVSVEGTMISWNWTSSPICSTVVVSSQCFHLVSALSKT
mmetsp:Transcript_18361/g.62467  ORF Transcript_18361/g.62467 Transcript_18361/m.62467 type:complete len:229 (+) Transcript_18361:2307-2993(+)